MKKLKRVIATALVALVLTTGSALLVDAHTCPAGWQGTKQICWYDHAVGTSSGTHYCILICA